MCHGAMESPLGPQCNDRDSRRVTLKEVVDRTVW